jgi:septum formation protein
VADPGAARTRRLVLASGSPRRRELLALLDVAFDVVPADVDETPLPSSSPVDHVLRVAALKAAAGAALCPEALVIAADTVVDLDGEILGKPGSLAEAARMLRLLSGRDHLVHTAVMVARDVELVTTVVSLDDLADADIDRYVATGEPFDKAGAYAIQGRGAVLVREVHGSVTNVIGLPLTELRRLLVAAGLVLGR